MQNGLDCFDTPSTGAPLRCIDAGHPLRGSLERFIAHRFAEDHGARLTSFMPDLLGACHNGDWVAAAGMRLAAASTLFLERYLDTPVEHALGAALGHRVRRADVVEVGNLAAATHGGARRLIIAVTHALAGAGLRWVVFTGTPTLINSFRRLGLAPMPLAVARAERMGDALADWGRYYDRRPMVMGGDIRAGHATLRQMGLVRGAGHGVLHVA